MTYVEFSDPQGASWGLDDNAARRFIAGDSDPASPFRAEIPRPQGKPKPANIGHIGLMRDCLFCREFLR